MMLDALNAEEKQNRRLVTLDKLIKSRKCFSESLKNRDIDKDARNKLLRLFDELKKDSLR